MQVKYSVWKVSEKDHWVGILWIHLVERDTKPIWISLEKKQNF